MTKQFSVKPPPNTWTLFTDRDLGNIVPDALQSAGYNVERAYRPETKFVSGTVPGTVEMALTEQD